MKGESKTTYKKRAKIRKRRHEGYQLCYLLNDWSSSLSCDVNINFERLRELLKVLPKDPLLCNLALIFGLVFSSIFCAIANCSALTNNNDVIKHVSIYSKRTTFDNNGTTALAVTVFLILMTHCYKSSRAW